MQNQKITQRTILHGQHIRLSQSKFGNQTEISQRSLRLQQIKIEKSIHFSDYTD